MLTADLNCFLESGYEFDANCEYSATKLASLIVANAKFKLQNSES